MSVEIYIINILTLPNVILIYNGCSIDRPPSARYSFVRPRLAALGYGLLLNLHFILNISDYICD